MTPKLSYQDEEAIREFEEDTMNREIKKMEKLHLEYMKNNPDSKIVPWNVYFEQYEEELKNKIREKYKFQVV
jgi:hypothetical protein